MAAMTWRIFSTVVVSSVMSWAALPAQTVPNKNPLEGNPDAILSGMAGFRLRCADCHGTDGRGVRGPDITQVWSTGRSDEGLFKIIRRGIPGSEMPAFIAPRTSDREMWQMLAYLKTLATPASIDPPRGNAENGAKVFRALCAACHQGQRHRRPTRSRSVPHWHRPDARRAGAPASGAAPRIFAPASSRSPSRRRTASRLRA